MDEIANLLETTGLELHNEMINRKINADLYLSEEDAYKFLEERRVIILDYFNSIEELKTEIESRLKRKNRSSKLGFKSIYDILIMSRMGCKKNIICSKYSIDYRMLKQITT